MNLAKYSLAVFFALVALECGQVRANCQDGPAQEQAKGVTLSFDVAPGGDVKAALAKAGDDLEGEWRLVPGVGVVSGVAGQALEFDGYTTGLTREGKNVPALGNAFTISAWVAVNNYPWNWVPIVDQSEFDQVGFSLGMDAFGHVGLGASIDGVWRKVTSDETLPLKKWVHITGIVEGGAGLNNAGLTILIDGKPAGHLAVNGNFWQDRDATLIVGRVRQPMVSFPIWISHPQDASEYSFDGYMDEVSVAGGAISIDEDRQQIAKVSKPEGDVIPYAELPSGPKGAGPFGAIYASLKFMPSWDRLRRLGPDSDVVVRFDKSPMRLVFWQGTNYIPAWVTENGKWYTDEFLETWEDGCGGAADCEPMSDKQSRYSHASIVATSDARVIVHWRYALADARLYQGASPDPRTGWTDWADEYWTVYPDGVAVRKQILWSTRLDRPHEWQETIVINGPGQRPEDNIEPAALTYENMAGQTYDYGWLPKTDHSFTLPKGPPNPVQPPNANIQIVHLKSAQNPFQIVAPHNVTFDSYNFEPSYSMFEWWNHWPVAQVGSSGRPAIAPDRASHSSLSHIKWDAYAQTANSMTKLLLCGLVNGEGAAKSVLPLAKSWLSPPDARIGEGAAGNVEYDPAQRAYVVHGANETANSSMTIEMNSSADRPLVNPAFVIEGWGASAKVQVSIDGKPAEIPVRIGVEHRLEGDDAVVFVEMTATQPVKVKVESAAARERH